MLPKIKYYKMKKSAINSKKYQPCVTMLQVNVVVQKSLHDRPKGYILDGDISS